MTAHIRTRAKVAAFFREIGDESALSDMVRQQPEIEPVREPGNRSKLAIPAGNWELISTLWCPWWTAGT
jgi:hypothetical protein